MADPNAARRFMQTLGVLDGSGRVAPRHRRRAGIDIDELDSIGAEHPVELPPVPRETVVDEIEVIGDPRGLGDEERAAIDALVPTRSHDDHRVGTGLPGVHDLRVDPEENERRGLAAREAQERAERQRADHVSRIVSGYTPGSATARGNVRAALPDFVPDAVSDAIATVPGVSPWFDPETGAALVEGTMQGLTLGFSDELAGAARSGVWHPFGDEEAGRAYRRERDAARAAQEAAREGNPIAYIGAETIGSLPASMAAPSAGPGATLTRRVLTAGAAGAGLGAVQGSGRSEAEALSMDHALDVARDTALGGVMGAGSELGFAALQRARQRLRGAPEGTPPPGGDFTPEQVAEARRRMDAGDPDVFDAMQTRESLEDAAAARRVRSTADSAALADVRRAADYRGPGGEGYRGLARDLDATGVSPRGSITRADEAQRRATRIGDRASRDIHAVTEQMDAAAQPLDMPEGRFFSNTDDELDRIWSEGNARGRAAREAEARAEQEAADAAAAEALARDMAEPGTGGARGGRARPRGQSLRDRGSEVYDPDADPTDRQSFAGLLDDVDEPPPADIPALARETRREVTLAADPARVRYSPSSLRTEIQTPSGRDLPDQGTTVERLLREAREMSRRATTPEQHAAAAQMESLARDIDGLEPELYSDALERLRGLDAEARYGSQYPGASTVTPERTIRAREARRGVRADMDRAVEQTLGPDALASLRAARSRSGVAQTVGQLSERGAAREAANRQVGLTDTLAATSAANRDPQAGPLQRIWNAAESVIVNRYLRGLEHTTVAAFQERASDAMARDIVRRLAEQPVTEPMARALASALRRGPRAFGAALITIGGESPEAQQVIVEAVRPRGGDPYEDIEGVQYDDDPVDAPIGRDPYEDIEGVEYEDEDDDAPPARGRR